MDSPGTHTLRAAYAKHILGKHLEAKYLAKEQLKHHGKFNFGDFQGLPEGKPILMPEDLQKQHDQLWDSPPPFEDRICIVGAGVAGLVIAHHLLLAGVPAAQIDILEASDRVGGRCYTYKFPDDPSCPHNYYDIGAMRIPDIPVMASTLNLISQLGLESKLVPYIYKNNQEPCSYFYGHTPPDGSKFEEAIAKIVKVFIEQSFEAGFEHLISSGADNFSTRAWLMTQANPPLTYEETAVGEISDTSTGLFDQAFTETICDYYDFTAAGAKGKWYRLEGGMSVLTDTLRERIQKAGKEVALNTPVVAMSDEGETIAVTTQAKGASPLTRRYHMVFNTTTMACLQRMDLEGLRLPGPILTGIRSLGYDRSTKVAIKFRSPWWRALGLAPGGVSSSDLPISNVVYPSWDDGPGAPAVLMVSYSWAQDATRMGALVPAYGPRGGPPSADDDPVVALCLRNLVKLWSGYGAPAAGETGAAPAPAPATATAPAPAPPTYEFLRSQYLAHHAFAWSHDQHTGGAFALFGPGQFRSAYPPFQELLCSNKLAICGEAVSAHHAWISGAIDSAYYAGLKFLLARGRVRELANLKASEFGGGRGKHPDEVDEKLLYWTVKLGDGGIEGGESG